MRAMCAATAAHQLLEPRQHVVAVERHDIAGEDGHDGKEDGRQRHGRGGKAHRNKCLLLGLVNLVATGYI